MNQYSFWNRVPSELFESLKSGPEGLSSREGTRRFQLRGKNHQLDERSSSQLGLFFSQFKSPLTSLLMFAAGLSFVLHNRTDAIIILLIVIVSGMLSFFQERGAKCSVEKLISLVKARVKVFRDGLWCEIEMSKVVPGDIITCRAGDLIPGDCLILEAKDCFANEATLTGETFHVEKTPGSLPKETPLRLRTNALWMGSYIVSGTTKALVVKTGKETEFGKISERLRWRPLETAFENGVRHFGYLLMEVTLLLVLTIFALNTYLERPVLEAFLFAVALSVGLTPQLLPAIITINLSHGAKRMAKEKVIVKRLSSIENLGSMNVLCADKTGTLTKGVVQLDGAVDGEGNPSELVKLLSCMTAAFQTGYKNPIDEALSRVAVTDLSLYQKLDEIPYDFVRKKMTILVQKGNEKKLVSKGAFAPIVNSCSWVDQGLSQVPIDEMKQKLNQQFETFASQGYRVLGVAYKPFSLTAIHREDETELIFAGFLLFLDPPKDDIEETMEKMKMLGVETKIITGDHSLVAIHIAEKIGLTPKREKHLDDPAYVRQYCLTGEQMHKMSNNALLSQVKEKKIFAELEPHHKERIITILRKGGCVVGYLGDGINDVTALHAADIGISVDLAADVVREVADIVLLKKDLSVLLKGIQEGRRTFVNTMKYIYMATSANFGNMFSMAGVSLFIPFLPLLPKQILLTNLLTDIPEMAIATDTVEKKEVQFPVKWDLSLLKRFMVVFGLLSSLFDFMTFGALLYLFRSSPEVFRTGWFIESVISASMVILVIRTRRFSLSSPPSFFLTLGVCAVVFLALIFPLTPLARFFNFVPLPAPFYWAIGGIVTSYLILAELIKRTFYASQQSNSSAQGKRPIRNRI